MSALFPNVPEVPGVPVVNRASSILTAAISTVTQSRTAAQSGLDLLGDLDLPGAQTAFLSSSSLAQTAIGLIAPVFSDGSPPVLSLQSAAGMASGAASAILAGDTGGAISAGLQAIGFQTGALGSLQNALAPLGLPILGQSGARAQADISQQWGIYTEGGKLLTEVDNVAALEVLLEAQISDYPVENGGFASYNKVIRPFDVRLSMSKGGSVEDRQAFVKAIQDAWQSTDLYTVITPEVVYLDVNVVGVRRLVESDRGVGLTMLDVSLRKVRQTAKLSFADTKEPSGASPVNNGAVQTEKNLIASGEAQ